MTTLGLEVPAPVTRRLLHDTAASAAVSAALAMLPVEVSLDDATAATLHDMRTLHDAVLSATGGAGELTTALCARKRPELFPVLDAVCCTGWRLPPGSVAASWRALRAVLRDPEVRAGLARIFDAARRRGLRVDVFPLRQLAVLAAIARDRY